MRSGGVVPLLVLSHLLRSLLALEPGDACRPGRETVTGLSRVLAEIELDRLVRLHGAVNFSSEQKLYSDTQLNKPILETGQDTLQLPYICFPQS